MTGFHVILLQGYQLAARPDISFRPNATGAAFSVPIQIVAGLTLLALLPAVIMSITPFLRITIVLHFLRQALGTQGTPSNQVLLGISLFLTTFLVWPVATDIYTKGWEPLEQGQLSSTQAFQAASEPLKKFLLPYIREADLKLLLDLSHEKPPANSDELRMSVVVPAYILSELRTGFQIGAVLFLPFLVIDLVVASVTLSIGMVQLPPVMISAPFKILLFVLVDGWGLVVGSLMKSFYLK